MELKKGLDKVFEEVVALGIDFDKYKASRQDEAEQKPAKVSDKHHCRYDSTIQFRCNHYIIWIYKR